MAEILKAVPLGSSRGQRQHGVLAVEGLNGSLFVDAEHRCMLRRMQLRSSPGRTKTSGESFSAPVE
jgi:hypothetical protein